MSESGFYEGELGICDGVMALCTEDDETVLLSDLLAPMDGKQVRVYTRTGQQADWLVIERRDG